MNNSPGKWRTGLSRKLTPHESNCACATNASRACDAPVGRSGPSGKSFWASRPSSGPSSDEYAPALGVRLDGHMGRRQDENDQIRHNLGIPRRLALSPSPRLFVGQPAVRQRSPRPRALWDTASEQVDPLRSTEDPHHEAWEMWAWCPRPAASGAASCATAGGGGGSDWGQVRGWRKLWLRL